MCVVWLSFSSRYARLDVGHEDGARVVRDAPALLYRCADHKALNVGLVVIMRDGRCWTTNNIIRKKIAYAINAPLGAHTWGSIVYIHMQFVNVSQSICVELVYIYFYNCTIVTIPDYGHNNPEGKRGIIKKYGNKMVCTIAAGLLRIRKMCIIYI